MATSEALPALRVGPYARISDDDEQLGLGVKRQLTDISSLLQGRHEATEPYIDNDVSAYQRGVVRDDFERLLKDFISGTIDGMAPYDLDRLLRQPTDLERVIDAYDDAVRRGRRVVFLTVQGNIDLATPDGRTMARVLVAFANKASMDTARRVSRQKLERAMNGQGTSNFRAFGWNEDGTLKEDEAEIIRQAAKDVLNGIGLFVICSRLNREGIKTVRGSTWKTSAMRRILNAPRLAGLAVFRGEILIGEDGQPIKGSWAPLFPEDEWRAIVEALESNKRVMAQRSHSYLLTNIARCGLCGAGMVGGTPKTAARRYMCRSTDSGGCAKVGIVMDKLDRQIEDLVLAYLKDHTIETGDEVWEGQDRLTEVGEKISELMEEYRGGLSGSIVFPLVKKLEDEQKTLQAERGRFTRTQKRTTTITGEWSDLNLEERRSIILSVIQAIVIKPSGRTGFYDPDRVEVIWAA